MYFRTQLEKEQRAADASERRYKKKLNRTPEQIEADKQKMAQLRARKAAIKARHR